MIGRLGRALARWGIAGLKHGTIVQVATGDGFMKFNKNPGIDTGLLALLEDI